MTKVIGIITTKNRFELFKLACASALNQSRSLDELIVVSDSRESIYDEEMSFIDEKDTTLIRNVNSKNYAGSLNTAVSYIIKKYYIKEKIDINSIYVALLDDDDYWDLNYIKDCLNSIKPDTDFVISGINYILEDKVIQLKIPSNLEIRDFLVGNPHLQGSNTFIKFKTLLNIGGFDESMNSTIDRDMFVRVMLSNPNYSVVNKHLVFVNAYHNEDRVTVDPKRKLQGLKKFYRKYSQLMSEGDEILFFERIKKLLNIDIQKFDREEICLSDTYHDSTDIDKEFNILIGFIATDFESAKKLAGDICQLKRKNTRVLVLVNGIYDHEDLISIFDSSKIETKFITLDEVKRNNHKNQYGPFITDYVIEDKIGYISLARRVLHYHLYERVNKDEIIWILDEDVSLKQEIIINNQIITSNIPIDYIIERYKDSLDIGVGNITNDPAIPALSTARTNLVDYYYNLNKKSSFSSIISSELYDYYYDYSDSTNQHLEQPFNIDNNVDLKCVFIGKAISRKLVLLDNQVKEATNHGGNTLIFNKEVLKIPNLSIKIDNQYSRRGDFFWIQCCKRKGYKIKNLPFAVNHNRNSNDFDYIQEINKLKRDLFGSSLTKAYNLCQDTDNQYFREKYIEQVINRLAKILLSFYRIQALLDLVDLNNNFKQYFTDEKIDLFKNSILESLQIDKLKSSFTQLSRYISIYDRLSYEEKEVEIIKKNFKTDNVRLLGYGSEANVYTDDEFVFKVFHKELNNLRLFDENVFVKIKSLYTIEISKIEYLTIFKYQYETSTEYNGGHADELIQFIKEFKENDLVFTNVNARNFRVNSKNQLKLIDYGDSFKKWNNDDYQRMILRVYQLLKYNHISIIEFKTLINLSYKKLDTDFNYNFNRFEKVINQRSKEDIHDDLIISNIELLSPNKILDYGAGKCKIANYLSTDYVVSVFDIDTETLYKRAKKDIEVINDIDNHMKKYDLINCNLVLCAVEDNIADNIIKNFRRLINHNGVLILSICNPFFNDIGNTELRIESAIINYDSRIKYEKENRIYHTLRDEYHRPFSFYQSLLEENGFNIIDVNETEGYDLKSLAPIGEHLVLTCSNSALSKNEYFSHAIIIYVGNTSTSIIHQYFKSILKETHIRADIFMIYDNKDIKNREYCELLLSKSTRFSGKVKFFMNDEIIGYQKSVLKVFKEVVEENPKYKICTTQSVDFIINDENFISKIELALETNDIIVHSAFNEYNPFNNYLISDDNSDFLPMSFNLGLISDIEEYIIKYKYQIKDKYLYRKIRKV
ncbi:MAG: glycosyltransferase [Vulcanibacillus sp.]